MTAVSTAPAAAGGGFLLFETIAKMKPLLGLWERPIGELIDDLNAAVKAAGIEFGENEFSFYFYHPDMPETFEAFRQVHCYASRGSNEGYYINVIAERVGHPPKMIASAKTWDWASALAIAAVGTRVLSD